MVGRGERRLNGKIQQCILFHHDGFDQSEEVNCVSRFAKVVKKGHENQLFTDNDTILHTTRFRNIIRILAAISCQENSTEMYQRKYLELVEGKDEPPQKKNSSKKVRLHHFYKKFGVHSSALIKKQKCRPKYVKAYGIMNHM